MFTQSNARVSQQLLKITIPDKRNSHNACNSRNNQTKNAVEFARKYDNVHIYMLRNPLQMYTDFHAPTQSRAEQKQSKNRARTHCGAYLNFWPFLTIYIF